MKRIIIVLMFISLTACGEKGKKVQKQQDVKPFEMIEIPAMMQNPEDRAAYLAEHYWDKYDFSDTVRIKKHDGDVEQAFADYLNILNYTKPDKMVVSVKNMANKTFDKDTAVYGYFFRLYEKYLYDGNSPMRNEEFYIPYLEAVVNSDKIDEIEKIRPKALLELVLKNRKGEKASDFSFKTTKGQTVSLYGTSADYILVLFYNPGCSACREIFAQISNSVIFNEMLKKGSMKILAVYPDQDLEEFNKYLSDIPTSWINGYDGEKIKETSLYDLKAIPSLYLLDRSKTVLLKDANFIEIENFLANL